jgi:hypothetical protein
MALMSKRVRSQNDVCICKCGPSPGWIASLNDAAMSLESRDFVPMEALGWTAGYPTGNVFASMSVI